MVPSSLYKYFINGHSEIKIIADAPFGGVDAI